MNKSFKDQILQFNPWLASATYEEEDEYRFKGRDYDASKIVSMLQQGDSVVCYAASGDGKSSLINAAICPAIRRLGYFPIRLTFTTDEFYGIGLPAIPETNQIDFDRFIWEKIQQSIEDYRKSFLKKRNFSGDYEIAFEKLTKYKNVNIDNCLWWKLRSEIIEIPFGEFDYIPVLIFDQFEEIFRASWKGDFFKWLEVLMKDVLPDRVAKAIDVDIEEFSTKKLFKTIFSMRYEYIGELDYWCSQQYFIPQVVKNRYYLRPLNIHQAKQIICDQPRGDTDALSIINSKSDEILARLIADNSKKNADISAILLSILCFTYYNQLIDDKNNTSLPSTKDMVAKYYRNKTECVNPENLLTIEKELVSYDGTRKRIRKKDIKNLELPISNSDVQDITVGEVLLSEHILRQFIINSEEYIELSHDKLAEVVKEKIDNANNAELQRINREKNRDIRLIKENVLTIFGRELFENQILDFGPSTDNDNFRTLLVSEIIRCNFSFSGAMNRSGITSLSQIINDSDSEQNNICLSFFSEEGKMKMTKDGISKLLVKIDAQRRVSKILFYGKHIGEEYIVTTRNGFCGIELKYDTDTGNEIQRTYLGKDGKPTNTILCYSIIKREYDEYNRPVKTIYLDTDGVTLCKHFNGNCGFISEYDNNGNEIYRMYIDEVGNPCQILKGNYGQKAIYNEQNQLEYIINIDQNKTPCKSFWGAIALYVEYDPKSGKRIKETFCDENLRPHTGVDGYATAILKYNDQEMLVECALYDEEGNAVINVDGYHKYRITYNHLAFPEYVSFYGVDNRLKFTNNGDCIIQRIYNEVGQEIEMRNFGPDLSPSYSRYFYSVIRTEYENRLISAINLFTHDYRPLKFNNLFSRKETIWDHYGRHDISENIFYYSNNGDANLKIHKAWRNDNEYIITKCELDDNPETIHLRRTDSAGRDIYEEEINSIEGYHHKSIEYNSLNLVSKELYFNADNTPYFDELGDCGCEFIYNDRNQIIGWASVDENGFRRINDEGHCVQIVEQDSYRNSRRKFYDTDGITPVCNNKIGAHCLDFDDRIYDENMELTNGTRGWAYYDEGYYDKDHNPTSDSTGVHKVEIEDKENIRIERCVDLNNNLVNCELGYAIKEISTFGDFKEILTMTKYTIRYFDSDGKPVDCANPYEPNMVGFSFWFDENNKLRYATNSKNKKIYGSRIAIMMRAILVLILIIPLGLVYAIYSIFKSLRNTNEPPCEQNVILVKDVINEIPDPNDIMNNTMKSSLAQITDICKNDIILSYGDWDCLQTSDVYESIESFEKEFNLKTNQYKKVTVGKIRKDGSSRTITIDSFWLPDTVIGIRLGDAIFPGSNKEYQELLDKYLRHKEDYYKV